MYYRCKERLSTYAMSKASANAKTKASMNDLMATDVIETDAAGAKEGEGGADAADDDDESGGDPNDISKDNLVKQTKVRAKGKGKGKAKGKSRARKSGKSKTQTKSRGRGKSKKKRK